MEHSTMLSTSTLTGDKVYNGAGEDLGKIEDIVLDTESGQVAYAVLSFGGFLGMGDKLFAVPWSSLRLDTANHAFVLDLPRERLEEAEGFDKDNWPNMADASFRDRTYQHYGATRYWD